MSNSYFSPECVLLENDIKKWCLIKLESLSDTNNSECLYEVSYLMISKDLKILVSFSTAVSTCSFVWVAINAKRKRVSCGAHAGGITGLINTPSSNANLVDKKVFSVSRT